MLIVNTSLDEELPLSRVATVVERAASHELLTRRTAPLEQKFFFQI